MKITYFEKLNVLFSETEKSLHKLSNFKKTSFTLTAIFLFIIYTFTPLNLFAQKIEFSYSYFNLTRNTIGGTLQQGDIMEIHALIKINATVKKAYYTDTIPAGLQYVANSMKLITNEGVLFPGSGPYTDAGDGDNGVYVPNGVSSRIRINLASTISPGSVPKFYGSTLFIIAYQLQVTANNGDTIHPTGNFYFDTSGTIMQYRFNYGGIKVIANRTLCNNFSSATFTAESSFGSGNTQNRAAPAIVPGYTKIDLGANSPADNYYSIANNTSADGTTNNAGPFKPTTNNHRVFGGFWDIIGDHTGSPTDLNGNPPPAAGQPGGYMLVVNAAFTTGEVYRDTIKNVCPNTFYEFSAYIRNICKVCGIDQNGNPTYTPGVLPNLTFAVNDVDYYTTGNINYDYYWKKRGFLYKTGPAETQFTITIKNNAAGGGGNDWVLDDIKLATCYPDLVNSPKDTATSCLGAPLILSDTVKSYFNNYTNFCWEKSADGVNWISAGVCGSKVPILVNGLWQFVVDTSFTTIAADSGTFYRLKVGTSAANLNNPNCSVANSQKIFLKVFNVNCTLLNTQLLSFSGNIINNNTVLHWTSENETNLKQYEVEKSIDGVNYSRTGIVATMNTAGGSNYSFIDPEPIATVAYYRLKLAGLSGSGTQYSKIIVLYNKNALFNVSAVNPFRSNLKINIFLPEDGNALFNLYDIFGKIITKKNLQLNKGTSQLILDDVERLPAGMYILRTQFNNKIIQNKLFKVD